MLLEVLDLEVYVPIWKIWVKLITDISASKSWTIHKIEPKQVNYKREPLLPKDIHPYSKLQ